MIMRSAAVLSIFVGVSFVVMPVVSTPNFNLATRQKPTKGYELHKRNFVSSSSRSAGRHHKKRHAISRRDAEVMAPPVVPNTDQSSPQENVCTGDKQAEIWNSIVYCQPNPTLVELQKPPLATLPSNNNIVHMMPGNRKLIYLNICRHIQNYSPR